MDTIILDENHKYWIEGRQIPGHSEILEDLGFKKNPYWTEEGRKKGIALHKWLLFYAQGNKTDDLPDPRIASKVEGIKKFFKENKFIFANGETPLNHVRLRYCVTPDLWGFFGNHRVVIELKNGNRMMRHRLQTAAQAIALEDNSFPNAQRYALYLKHYDYKLEMHTDEEDLPSWEAIVLAYHAKQRYK